MYLLRKLKNIFKHIERKEAFGTMPFTVDCSSIIAKLPKTVISFQYVGLKYQPIISIIKADFETARATFRREKNPVNHRITHDHRGCNHSSAYINYI